MKTLPTVRLADASNAAGLPDLPEEIQLAMTDIAGAAREGLLAMSVAAGMAVMQAMFEAEIAEVAGPKGKHDRNRTAVRHGSGRGLVTLGGRRVPVTRPRARTLDGREVPPLARRPELDKALAEPGIQPRGTPRRRGP
jgi:putative transposase